MNYTRLLILLVSLIVPCLILALVFERYLLWIGIGLGVLLVIFIFLLIRFRGFRRGTSSVFSKLGKWLKEKPQEQPIAGRPQRTAIPKDIQKQVFVRAKDRCQFPYCQEREGLEIHHIRGEPTNHNLNNLILLCRNHHYRCGQHLYREHQLIAWINGKYPPLSSSRYWRRR